MLLEFFAVHLGQGEVCALSDIMTRRAAAAAAKTRRPNLKNQPNQKKTKFTTRFCCCLVSGPRTVLYDDAGRDDSASPNPLSQPALPGNRPL